MQVSETKELSSPNELSKEIRNMSVKSSKTPTQLSKFSPHQTAIQEVRKRDIILKLI